MESSLVQFLSTAPHDIKTEILHYTKPTQWWYLNQTFDHNDWVYSVCFNTMGNLLATGSSDKKARIFDIQQKIEVASFDHNDCVLSVCFNTAGNLLATASYDRKARIFNIQHNKEVASFNHNNWVKSVCFNTAGNLLATASSDKKARIFAL